MNIITIPTTDLRDGDIWVSADESLWLLSNVRIESNVRADGVELGRSRRAAPRMLGASWKIGDTTDVLQAG